MCVYSLWIWVEERVEYGPLCHLHLFWKIHMNNNNLQAGLFPHHSACLGYSLQPTNTFLDI